MPVFIDPTGEPTYGIGICDRCHFKFPLAQLTSDPNYPGLKVCWKDKDQYDPWRLPARQTERINLPFVRPDIPLDDLDAPTQSLIYYIIATEDGHLLGTEEFNLLEVE